MFEVSKYWEPSQTLSWLDEARRATESFNDVFEKDRKLLDQIASFTDPFLDLVERLKLEQIAPWASQMEATVEHVQRMLQSLPDDDDPEWDTLGSRLEDGADRQRQSAAIGYRCTMRLRTSRLCHGRRETWNWRANSP